jgi:hypothetical protein
VIIWFFTDWGFFAFGVIADLSYTIPFLAIQDIEKSPFASRNSHFQENNTSIEIYIKITICYLFEASPVANKYNRRINDSHFELTL